MNKKSTQSGQILLIVLLAVAVVATVVLSVVSRSVVDVGVTTREEESLRAFSAAEAGLEEALITASPGETVTGDFQDTESTVSTYSVDVRSFPENLRQFSYPYSLVSGETGTVWFVTRDDNEFLDCDNSNPCFNENSLNLCWGTPSSGRSDTLPAIEVSVLYRTQAGEYAVSRNGYDPISSRASDNNFQYASASCSAFPGEFASQATINFRAGGLNIPSTATMMAMRVKMLYNGTVPHSFAVSAGADLPTQGKQVSSEGVAGEATRRINAFMLHPEIPHIFDSVLFSAGNIEK